MGGIGRGLLAAGVAVCAVASGITFAAPALAFDTSSCDTTFTGHSWSDSGNWFNAANWDHGVPTATTVACIGGYFTDNVTIIGNAVAKTVLGTGFNAQIAIGESSAGGAPQAGSLTVSRPGATGADAMPISVQNGSFVLTGGITWSGQLSTTDEGWINLGMGGTVVESEFSGQVTGTGHVEVLDDAGVAAGPHVVVDAPAAGSLTLTSVGGSGAVANLGPHAYSVDDTGVLLDVDPSASLTLIDPRLPAGQPALTVPVTLGGGTVSANLTLNGPVTFGLAGLTVAAGVTLTVAQPIELPAAVYEVDGTLVAPSLHLPAGDLKGSGTIKAAVTNDGSLYGSLSFTKPYVQNAHPNVAVVHQWADPPFQFTDATIPGLLVLDADDTATPTGTRNVLQASGTLNFTAAQSVIAQGKRSFTTTLAAHTLTATIHDATTTVTGVVEAGSTAERAVVDVTVTAAEGVATRTVSAWDSRDEWCRCTYSAIGSATLSDGKAQIVLENPPPGVYLEYDGDALHLEEGWFGPYAITYGPEPTGSTGSLPPTGATSPVQLFGGGAAVQTTAKPKAVATPRPTRSQTIASVEKALRAKGFLVGDIRAPHGYPKTRHGHHYAVTAFAVQTSRRVKVHGHWQTVKSYRVVKPGTVLPVGTRLALILTLV